MSVLNIPTALSNAITSLTSHHGHKKGVHDGVSSATASTDGQPTGSTQSLFGTLLDSIEQVVGIQTPTAAPSAVNAPSSIATAQAALKQG